MWWDVAADMRAEFEDWHSHEHFPERMSVPGFLRGSRWTNAKDGFFVLYELDRYETLTSPRYLERLNNPTPWSVKMMPHHREMVRSQCRVVESWGGGVARCMLSVRISPRSGQAVGLHSRLRDVLAGIPMRPGLTGGHLLLTETPDIDATAEQRIRGFDAVADWIVLVSGYEARALSELIEREFDPSVLIPSGSRPEPIACLYDLSHALSAQDRR